MFSLLPPYLSGNIVLLWRDDIEKRESYLLLETQNSPVAFILIRPCGVGKLDLNFWTSVTSTFLLDVPSKKNQKRKYIGLLSTWSNFLDRWNTNLWTGQRWQHMGMGALSVFWTRNDFRRRLCSLYCLLTKWTHATMTDGDNTYSLHPKILWICFDFSKVLLIFRIYIMKYYLFWLF